ncbi:acyl-CoA N-acyltransferase [Hypoxylon crocopeplum]|nr:acyl-CoA N-acyltransferase [Hypoxylon crocopeplum]
MSDSSVGRRDSDKMDLVGLVAAPGTAVDDTEDLADDDFAEIQKTKSYGSRQKQSHSNKYSKVQELLPFPFCPNVRPLTISDLESCVALENAAFTNPEHRCTREKFEYRLATCPELCIGLFCTVVPGNAKSFEIDTLPPSHPVETGRDDGARTVLLAHIIATRSDGRVVTDAAMDYPRDFRTSKRNTSGLGHQDAGSTVCVHSLSVHPKLQACGLGKLIMKSYLQQLKNSAIADYCALICQEYLISFYKRFNFEHQGPSEAGFGGGGWHDMTLEIDSLPPYSQRVLRS